LRRQEQVLRKLLGDRAAALADAAGKQVPVGGAQHAENIDPGMAVETAILDRKEGARHMGRQVADAHGCAMDRAIACEDRTIGGAQRDHGFPQCGLVEPGDLRQVIGVPGEHRAKRHDAPDRKVEKQPNGPDQPRPRRFLRGGPHAPGRFLPRT
jgi:hypothetical protein